MLTVPLKSAVVACTPRELSSRSRSSPAKSRLPIWSLFLGFLLMISCHSYFYVASALLRGLALFTSQRSFLEPGMSLELVLWVGVGWEHLLYPSR